MSKHMRTTRIRLELDKLIYCSSQIATECRVHMIRLNQIFHPLKGHKDELERELRALARQRPQEFANQAHAILRTGLRDNGDLDTSLRSYGI